MTVDSAEIKCKLNKAPGIRFNSWTILFARHGLTATILSDNFSYLFIYLSPCPSGSAPTVFSCWTTSKLARGIVRDIEGRMESSF